MAKTVADLLIERLIDWGVKMIFGLPGDGINGIFEALRTHKDKIQFIQVRHEEAAAFAACGYAKYTGRLGVCLATSGPGRHPPAQRPVRRQVRRPARAGHHRPHLPRPDRHATTSRTWTSTSSSWTWPSTTSASWARPTSHNVVDEAIQTALARRGVAHITIPKDIQEWTIGRRPRSKREHRAATAATSSRRHAPLPPRELLQAAADIINAGKKVAILAGRGCLAGARRGAGSWPSKLGAPVVKALLGKAVVPDDSPYTTGGIGLLGTAPSQDAMQECDTLRHRRQQLPLHAVLPQARPGQVRADRPRPDPHRPALPGRRRPGRRLPARPGSAAAAGPAARRTAASWRRPRSA